jgi:hypothetical protein
MAELAVLDLAAVVQQATMEARGAIILEDPKVRPELEQVAGAPLVLMEQETPGLILHLLRQGPKGVKAITYLGEPVALPVRVAAVRPVLAATARNTPQQAQAAAAADKRGQQLSALLEPAAITVVVVAAMPATTPRLAHSPAVRGSKASSL